jgi:transposase
LLGTQTQVAGWHRRKGYAPELNPVELVWGNLKQRELANLFLAVKNGTEKGQAYSVMIVVASRATECCILGGYRHIGPI